MRSATLTAIAFALVMLDGYDMLILSFVGPLVAEAFRLNAHQLGTLFAASFAGSMLGSLVFGAVADRFGRRWVLVGTMFAGGLATLACSQASSWVFFAITRFVSGMALGGALAAVIPLVAESFDKAKRSGHVTAMFVGYPLGAVVGGAITTALLQSGWRNPFIGAGVLTLVAAPAGLLFRETLAMDRPKTTAPGARQPGTLLQLFANGRAAPTLFAALGIFCLLCVAYLLNSWTPMLARSAGLGTRIAALSAVAINLGGVAGALLSIEFARRFGLLRVMVIMFALGSVAVAALGASFASPVALLSAAFIAGVLIIGGQLNCPAAFVRLYPESMRAAGVGLQLTAGRFGSIVGPLAAGQLLTARADGTFLYLAAGAACLVAAVCYALVGTHEPKA